MNRLLQTTFCLTLLGILAAWTSSSAEAVIIDDFTTAQSLVAAGADGTEDSGSVSDLVVPIDIIGGTRGTLLEKTGGLGSPPNAIRLNAIPVTSSMSINRDSGIAGRALLQWDGDDTTTPDDFADPTSNLSYLLGAAGDLTVGGGIGILLTVLEADLPGQTFELTLWDSAIAFTKLSLTTVPTAPPSFDLLFPFAAFSDPGFDFSSVGAITLAITGPVNSDLRLDVIGTYVPEPGAATLLGLGSVVALARLRRARRRVA